MIFKNRWASLCEKHILRTSLERQAKKSVGKNAKNYYVCIINDNQSVEGKFNKNSRALNLYTRIFLHVT